MTKNVCTNNKTISALINKTYLQHRTDELELHPAEDFLISRRNVLFTKPTPLLLLSKFSEGSSRSRFGPDRLPARLALLRLQVSREGGGLQHLHPQVPDVNPDVSQAPLPGGIQL